MAVNLQHPDQFITRHLGPSAADLQEMLSVLAVQSLDELIEQTVPKNIRLSRPLALPPGKSEQEMLEELRGLAARNQVFRSYIGMGYSDCITPPVILRNILENPGWYTQYTPYQAEISQGRLEALLNFQTMIRDLTAMDVANASLLDEATACAEAVHLLYGQVGGDDRNIIFVSELCHPQNIEVIRTRAEAVGVEVVVGDHRTFDWKKKIFGAILQYPASDGVILDYRPFTEKAHAEGALVCVSADLLSLCVLTPPGEFGADVVVGSSQRFGVPLGYGGPSAAFMAVKNEYVRKMPGRLIGVSEDANGRPALRMAIQTREQHIRREKATSNICTAQVLLAVVAGMYGVYHGPKGLRGIAERVHGMAAVLAAGLRRLGLRVRHEHFFDTIRVEGQASEVQRWHTAAAAQCLNLRRIDATAVGVSVDETTSAADVDALMTVFAGKKPAVGAEKLAAEVTVSWQNPFGRKSEYLTHPVFNRYHSETEMLRYIKMLEGRDLSLTRSMIPLGSCTMKLNATAEMIPITWAEWGRLHPYAPVEQAQGYQVIFQQLEAALAEITGFAGVSLQPNAGSQGEYAGLLVIRKFHQSRGQGQRNICLIPSSAHGTNPASAVMAGMKVVVVKCDDQGNVDVADLEARARQHSANLAALMITYPSTHGVFEAEVQRLCAIVHQHGGQVYMDGANLNAQVGLCRPAEVGADVCHINLHKTFCIPHGGGGPGMGPICVAPHLSRFLPRHPLVEMGGVGGSDGIGAVSAAPWGSASILLISWAYIRMMGGDGLTQATRYAILNANYVAKRLDDLYPLYYRGKQGRVAHECILDMRHLKKMADIEGEDVAKRLMDYGFHAPTMSFPIPNTLMVEPTESEAKVELDRFIEAMRLIWDEIKEIECGQQPRDSNVLKNAPHTAEVLAGDKWERPYSREHAAFPTSATRRSKFFPYVGRVNNVLGDRKLICACPPMEEYANP